MSVFLVLNIFLLLIKIYGLFAYSSDSRETSNFLNYEHGRNFENDEQKASERFTVNDAVYKGNYYDSWNNDFKKSELIDQTVEITRRVPIPVYKHVIEKIPYDFQVPVPKPVLLPVAKPYQVKILVPYPVPIPIIKNITIPIEKPVPEEVVKEVRYEYVKPVPVLVKIEKKYPVFFPVFKHIFVSKKSPFDYNRRFYKKYVY